VEAGFVLHELVPDLRGARGADAHGSFVLLLPLEFAELSVLHFLYSMNLYWVHSLQLELLRAL
jgi:hypothetical protein